jgi:hypothetical protein
MIIWKPIKRYSKRGVVKSSIPIFKYERYTPSDKVIEIEYKLSCSGRLYAEEITMEEPKNKLDKTSIKFYSTMIFLWIMLLIASWMQHIFIFILCESVSVAVVCLIIRRRIKKNSLTSHIPQDH